MTQSDPEPRPRRAGGLNLAAVGVLTAALLVALVAFRPGAEPRLSPHSAGGDQRTVIVAAGASQSLSSPDGPVRAERVRGAIPSEPVAATVLTDEECTPDRRGVSHCLNRLRLESGAELAIRHHHRMSEIACLTPGERVRVHGAAA